MPELVLALVIFALLAERVLASRGWDAKERTLLNRIVADTPAELIALEREPRPPRRPRRDDVDDPQPQIPIGL